MSICVFVEKWAKMGAEEDGWTDGMDEVQLAVNYSKESYFVKSLDYLKFTF